MRLLIKFVILVIVLMLLLPLPPLAVVISAVITLYVLEYLRAKNIALRTLIEEKYVDARRRIQARVNGPHKPFIDAETEKEALDIDELTRDVEEELERAKPIDELSETWLAKAERHRAAIRRAIWRTVLWPLRTLGRMLLSLTDTKENK